MFRAVENCVGRLLCVYVPGGYRLATGIYLVPVAIDAVAVVDAVFVVICCANCGVLLFFLLCMPCCCCCCCVVVCTGWVVFVSLGMLMVTLDTLATLVWSTCCCSATSSNTLFSEGIIRSIRQACNFRLNMDVKKWSQMTKLYQNPSFKDAFFVTGLFVSNFSSFHDILSLV